MPFFSGGRKRRDSLAKPRDVIRIAVLGAAKVGKTSLVRQFLEFKFLQKTRPTVDDIIQLNYKHEDNNYELELVDATGSYEFPAMRKIYIDTSDAFLIVMSVDSAESVKEAHYLHSLIRNRRANSRTSSPSGFGLQSKLSLMRMRHRSTDDAPRIVFVLNKMDLPAEKREVSVSTVQYDDEFGFENVVLTSAKENWNVDEPFLRLISQREASMVPDKELMEKSLQAALQHRRQTAPAINLNGASDNFLLALKNSISPSSKSNYIPIAP